MEKKFKKETIKKVVSQILNMWTNDIIEDYGTEGFLCWCEDGEVFSFNEEPDVDDCVELMGLLAPKVDELTNEIERHTEEDVQEPFKIQLYDMEYEVSKDNIVSMFQQVCSRYIDATEDAGNGMRNLRIEVNGKGVIIQVYPKGEYPTVWLLPDGNDEYVNLGDISFKKALDYLSMYSCSLVKLSHISDDKYIADKVLNLSCKHMTNLMRHIGLWDGYTYITDFTDVGNMILYAHSNGFDVKADIQMLHDYYVFGTWNDENKLYEIYGLCDEKEEIEDIIEIGVVVSTIKSNKEYINYLNELSNETK